MKKIILALILFAGIAKGQIVGGFVPSTRSLTINGVAQNLSANRSWTISAASISAVPYSGATGSVDLGAQSISAGNGTMTNTFHVGGTSNFVGALTCSNIVNAGTSSVGLTQTVTGQAKLTATNNIIGNTQIFSSTANTLTTGNTGTVAVLSDVVFTTTHFHSATGTFDNFTYYFDKSFAGISTVAGVIGKTYIPYDCTLIGYSLLTYIGGTLGSAEAQGYYVRVNNTTDITLTAAGTATAITNINTASNLNTNLSAGDYIEIKGVCPDMTTGYTTTSRSLTLFFKKR